MMLPEIVKAVGGEMEIFVDCGIESGMDAFKAIALGATAVNIGRPIISLPLKKKAPRELKSFSGRITGELKTLCTSTASRILRTLTAPSSTRLIFQTELS